MTISFYCGRPEITQHLNFLRHKYARIFRFYVAVLTQRQINCDRFTFSIQYFINKCNFVSSFVLQNSGAQNMFISLTSQEKLTYQIKVTEVNFL